MGFRSEFSCDTSYTKAIPQGKQAKCCLDSTAHWENTTQKCLRANCQWRGLGVHISGVLEVLMLWKACCLPYVLLQTPLLQEVHMKVNVSLCPCFWTPAGIHFKILKAGCTKSGVRILEISNFVSSLQVLHESLRCMSAESAITTKTVYITILATYIR